MIKIMLVEDDKSLREIYGVRLLAEGYDIVSAGDGEEALAMAIKERPQLIISDVMMPKVSGYDMLDILRSTTETKNIRVIMMTALSSDEQRTRAESLGADRYLVKSQVGIEDVVRVVHEVLGDGAQPAPATAAPEQTPSAATPVSAPAAAPATPVAPVPATPPPAAAPATPVPAPAPVTPPLAQPAATPAVQPQPVAPTPQVPVTPPPTPAATPPVAPQPVQPVDPTAAATPPSVVKPPEPPKPASLKSRVIQPLSDPNVSPIDINELLNKELAKEAGLTGIAVKEIPTTAEEKALVEEQLESFQPPEPTPVEAPEPIQAGPAPEQLMPTPGLSTPSPQPAASPVAPEPVPTTSESAPQQPPAPL